MGEPDYDDPEVENAWCEGRQKQVEQYLRMQDVNHGRIGAWPAWHLAPYVSIWAVESAAQAGWVGWWVICGDLPTDCISSATIKHPRDAMRAIALRWIELAGSMKQGASHAGFTIGSNEDPVELAPLLEARGNLLLEWVEDNSCWAD